jgi:hypothetical protein
MGTLVASLLLSQNARAIRPFVTDDARVVGHKLAQLETWLFFEESALQHNALAAIGPTNWLELTAGWQHGRIHSGANRGYSITGPIIQGKALLLPAVDDGPPGFAVAAGVLPPFGHGEFVPPGWSAFGYAATTESLFDEALLLHANLGLALGKREDARGEADGTQAVLTAGFGAQARLLAGLHAVGEIYHGDPYDSEFTFIATQMGARYIFSDHVQIDGTFGTTITGLSSENEESARWGTLGLRLVTGELW